MIICSGGVLGAAKSLIGKLQFLLAQGGKAAACNFWLKKLQKLHKIAFLCNFRRFFEGKLQVASWPDCRCIIIDAKMGLKLYKKPFLYNYWAFFRAIIIHFSFCSSVLSAAVSETSKNTPFQIHFHITKKAVPSKRHRPQSITISNTGISRSSVQPGSRRSSRRQDRCPG